jgi:hypothetical protein
MDIQELIQALSDTKHPLYGAFSKIVKNNARTAISTEAQAGTLTGPAKEGAIMGLQSVNVLTAGNVYDSFGLWKRIGETTYEATVSALTDFFREYPVPGMPPMPPKKVQAAPDAED